MSVDKVIECISCGRTSLGIEIGSTRIKSVLITDDHEPVAAGSFEWESEYIDGNWTYSLDDVFKGIQESYRNLFEDVKKRYGLTLSRVGSIGISAMMHGYLAFEGEKLLVPFRTWRNTYTEKASKELTGMFQYNIPQRWSIAHLYQAILNGEDHVKRIDYLVTLSGYVHWQLTGKKVLGIGDASGMFPIDIHAKDYNGDMLCLFDSVLKDRNMPFRTRDILPKVLAAGADAGVLTEKGARLIDPAGRLKPGIPLCPPEGDAGTGMVATNSIARYTGNVSAGTSVFAMFVLDKELKKVYPEIDLVTTPAGDLVAMVHCNNCSSELNAWVSLFKEYTLRMGFDVEIGRIYETLFNMALEGEEDGGELLAYNYLSGEHITGFEKGCPLFAYRPGSVFNLANFMRTLMYSSVATLRIGMDILNQEDIRINNLRGHGGFFKTKGVGQRVMAAALNVPVSVLDTAGEGGAWGIALLASYMKNRQKDETLTGYLDGKVFAQDDSSVLEPDEKDVKGFNVFLERYKRGLEIERAAVESLYGD